MPLTDRVIAPSLSVTVKMHTNKLYFLVRSPGWLKTKIMATTRVRFLTYVRTQFFIVSRQALGPTPSTVTVGIMIASFAWGYQAEQRDFTTHRRGHSFTDC